MQEKSLQNVEDNMVTGKQVKAARALLQWTQTKLSRESGVSRITIGNYEREATHPHEPTLRAIGAALSVEGIVFGPGNSVRLEPAP
jgi:transcriptional regulator with XRE-family HTH domain